MSNPLNNPHFPPRESREQDLEALVDGLIAEEAKDGGVSRTLMKLRGNQRLTGNDYRRLTNALFVAYIKMVDKAEDLQKMESSHKDEN